MISYIERTYFNDLLNRGGYVLDFSTYRFDEFTLHSVGIALCETYNLSKGKSLNEFINEGDNDKVVKLLDDLLEYYEVRYSLEIESDDRAYNGSTYKSLYDKCKEIVEREKQHSKKFSKVSEELKKKFSSKYMNQQIDLMVAMCNENPTEAIGKSKELLESCCKTIIESNGEIIKDSINMGQLVKQTLSSLNIPNKGVTMDLEEEKIVKQITGSLNGLSSGIIELRNHYGSGHGRSAKFNGLTKRHAELSVGASITLVRYLWDTFLLINENK
ncbi:TPA: abortive infection family protein [Streptococcus agalactiae]